MREETTPDPVDVYVGVTVRASRKRQGMSQEALSQAIGVTFQQVQKYERGANRVSASMLSRIAAAVDAPIQNFFPGVDETGHAVVMTATHRLAACNGGIELAEAYLAIPASARASLLSVANALRGVTAVRQAVGEFAGEEALHVA